VANRVRQFCYPMFPRAMLFNDTAIVEMHVVSLTKDPAFVRSLHSMRRFTRFIVSLFI